MTAADAPNVPVRQMHPLWRNLRYDLPAHFFMVLTAWLPDNTPFLRLRGWLVGRFLGSCGADLRLGRGVTFYSPGSIHIGSHVYIALGCWFMASGGRITIEDEVQFGPYCLAVTADHTRLRGSFRYGVPNTAPITIKRGAWIAGHVTLTAGTVVGAGTLVAASAVTRGELPDHVMAAGQPAKVVRSYDE